MLHVTRTSSALADDAYKEAARATLKELDWCLAQLESMQTHKSVSEMATNKVRVCDEAISINHHCKRVKCSESHDFGSAITYKDWICATVIEVYCLAMTVSD